MTRKALIVLGIFVLTGGIVFAQNNTITVDLGPTIIGAAFQQVGKLIADEAEGINMTGLGFGGQYERQINSKLSAALRGAYLGTGFGMTELDDSGAKATLKMDLKSFSIEGHVRFYPFESAFFLDGMMGYANLAVGLSGDVTYEEYGHKLKKGISISPSRNYLKLGAKLGWRVDFGKPRGFIFEPSFGYSYGIGLGDTIGKKLVEAIGVGDDIEISDFDEAFKYIENFIFIGGPRLSLAIGWRF